MRLGALLPDNTPLTGRAVQRVYERFQRVPIYLAGISVIAIMVLLTTNIIVRFTDFQAVWLSGLAKLLLIFMVFVPLGYLKLEEEHLTVAFMYDRLPARSRHIIDYGERLIGTSVVVITLLSAFQAFRFFGGRTSSSGIPTGLLFVPAIVGLGLLTVEYLREAVTAIREEQW